MNQPRNPPNSFPPILHIYRNLNSSNSKYRHKPIASSLHSSIPMGNYISCTLISTSSIKHYSSTTKLILPNGEIRTLDQPQSIKAAELMLETPNYFLVNSKSLQIGRRFFALNADEDLEIGNVYVMFPMKRVNSVVTATDVGVLLLVATKANNTTKRVTGNGKSKVLPEEHETGGGHEMMGVTSRLNLDDIDDDTISEFQLRLSLCRSKKPLLETITEEPATVFSSR